VKEGAKLVALANRTCGELIEETWNAALYRSIACRRRCCCWCNCIDVASATIAIQLAIRRTVGPKPNPAGPGSMTFSRWLVGSVVKSSNQYLTPGRLAGGNNAHIMQMLHNSSGAAYARRSCYAAAWYQYVNELLSLSRLWAIWNGSLTFSSGPMRRQNETTTEIDGNLYPCLLKLITLTIQFAVSAPNRSVFC